MDEDAGESPEPPIQMEEGMEGESQIGPDQAEEMPADRI